MSDWRILEGRLTRAWEAFYRASHAAPGDAPIFLVELRNACRDAEKSAEGILVEIERLERGPRGL